MVGVVFVDCEEFEDVGEAWAHVAEWEFCFLVFTEQLGNADRTLIHHEMTDVFLRGDLGQDLE